MTDLEQDEGPKADLDLCTGPKDAYVVEVKLMISFDYLPFQVQVHLVLFIVLCYSEHHCHVCSLFFNILVLCGF